MEEKPSDRVIDQRIRNRIMEAVYPLAQGDAGVEEAGSAEYFESFYDWIPHHDEREMFPNSAITPAEQALLLEVSKMLDAACDSMPGYVEDDHFIGSGWEDDDLIGSGWPKRIQPIAQKALDLMVQRGRFSEDHEEMEPTCRGPWP